MRERELAVRDARLVKHDLLPVRALGNEADDDGREILVRIVAAPAEHVARAGGRFARKGLTSARGTA